MVELYRSDICNVDINKPLLRTYAGIVLSTGDKLANRFGANVYRQGEAVDLTACAVTGYFIRPNRETVVIPGAVEGNTAYVDLPQACYTASGSFSLAIKISSTEITQTIRVIDGCIRLSQTDALIDPGEAVPSLDELFAVIADAKNATDEAYEVIDAVKTTAAPAIVETKEGTLLAVADALEMNAVEAVSYISCVQSGEGKPNPDNIRLFTGWDAANLYHAETYDAAANPAFAQNLPETIYGGYMNWTTGLLTVDKAVVVYDGTEDGWSKSTVVSDTMRRKPPADLSDVALCSHYIVRSVSISSNDMSTSAGQYINFRDSAHAVDVDTWLAYLVEQAAAGTPLTVLYTLKTPIETQLTQQQLALLEGVNNVWSDCGETKLVYMADTKLYIDNKFAEIQNAILAQGANI